MSETDMLIYVYLNADNLNSGDQVTMSFNDAATGVTVTSVPFDPVSSAGSSWFYAYFTVSGAHRGKSLEVIVSYNGSPMTGWERPTVITFV